jgi:spore germination protein YaaH
LSTGCKSNLSENSPEEISKAGNGVRQEILSTEAETGFTAWEAYWSNETVVEETLLLQGALQKVVHFAAYFNARNELFIPDETTRIFSELKAKKLGMVHYLSIVNDKINGDGSSSLKDTEVLYDIFSKEESMNSHIEAILDMALTEGYDGIEIDYEAIRQDKELWKLFIKFCEKLYERLVENELLMRIVLEPSAPVEEFTFPEGPEYVMMCYNLYGSSSEPGPKADKNFIKDLLKKMEELPGEKSFAFATGGFDWYEDGNVKALTETQAEALREEYSVASIRDNNSSALTFQYVDQAGTAHEVWYADGKTLVTWMMLIKDSGDYGISLWRLNENQKESLNIIKDWIMEN